ncbi:CRISPR-associated protein Csd2 [Anaerobranca californiensis DSM 14826]|jgi:CRISPR-associated protein Csd2|uniref:CRISPR-associated protein Csd2 n=1 Tax=Anaerobranca californiensis DSM 14826 TaxID=1120989 RepID=A0A1M6MKI1_9FIRM|nr:type I-C CRISPR-associated protein Cas7/Csd2 [Anaerobranca californiensis]SHJ83967.1 CRISPR-associated protein Csd2 [Anaerobranca californiensis DSM 14826]
MNLLDKRYEFVVLFDVENGNPNGDPDAGNMPRIDYETGHGIVTDVCIKRKVRNYIEIKKNDSVGYRIYIKEGVVLNNINKEAYEYLNETPRDKKQKPNEKATQFMCKNFYDVRAFGAVMSTDVNCGQVRGPVQLNFARSIDPIFQQEISITRMAVTNEKDIEKERTIGRKYIVPYGLYKLEGYVSAYFAEKTYFTKEDLELLWEALVNMFEHDHSAARGKMTVRKLIIFEHQSKLGNAPAHILFDLIKIKRKNPDTPPRFYCDYEVVIDKDSLPEGVSIIEKV